MTTATTKTAYTAEQTKEVVSLWNDSDKSTQAKQDAVINMLATKFGKTAKSIISKLSREKVYTAKAYTTKNGEKPVKKDQTADAIGAMLNLPENDVDSLTKANKTALVAISTALASSVPLEVLTPENEKMRNSLSQAIGTSFKMGENDTNSLNRIPLSALQALYQGVQNFDFINDVLMTIDELVEKQVAE